MPRDLIAIPMRHLGGAMQFEHLAGAVVAPDGAAGLERHAGMAPDAQLQRNRRMRVAEGRIDVAVFLADHARLGRAARLELAGLLLRPQQRRQFLDLQHDPVGDVLGEIRILGKHRRDRIADIAHPAAGQYALAIAHPVPRSCSGESRSAECRPRPRRSRPHARPALRERPPYRST